MAEDITFLIDCESLAVASPFLTDHHQEIWDHDKLDELRSETERTTTRMMALIDLLKSYFWLCSLIPGYSNHEEACVGL